MKANVVQPLNLTKAFAVLKGVNENQVRAKIIEGVVVKFTLNSSLKTNQTLYANILPPQKNCSIYASMSPVQLRVFKTIQKSTALAEVPLTQVPWTWI